MSDAMERIRKRESDDRYITDASSRFEGAVRRLQNGDPRWSGIATEYFMWKAVSRLLEIVELLPDHDDPDDNYMQEDIRRDLQQMNSVLKKRDLAKKMERSNGRTPEEQVAFAAKAKELRGE